MNIMIIFNSCSIIAMHRETCCRVLKFCIKYALSQQLCGLSWSCFQLAVCNSNWRVFVRTYLFAKWRACWRFLQSQKTALYFDHCSLYRLSQQLSCLGDYRREHLYPVHAFQSAWRCISSLFASHYVISAWWYAYWCWMVLPGGTPIIHVCSTQRCPASQIAAGEFVHAKNWAQQSQCYIFPRTIQN